VILPVDASDFTFYDCAYEELLQALGPIIDDPSVPWSMFNDDVQMGFFDVYDRYLLNILYDPRIRPGMTKEVVIVGTLAALAAAYLLLGRIRISAGRSGRKVLRFKAVERFAHWLTAVSFVVLGITGLNILENILAPRVNRRPR
jgi:Protein of unknown function (DUF2927)